MNITVDSKEIFSLWDDLRYLSRHIGDYKPERCRRYIEELAAQVKKIHGDGYARTLQLHPEDLIGLTDGLSGEMMVKSARENLTARLEALPA
ncbi:MAG: hypothetical protein LIP02_04155 [Bacteroidales bacterium]|nr:hypothetical protein [Bacteroidales bacterium]